MNLTLCEHEIDLKELGELDQVESHVKNRLHGRVWDLRLLLGEAGLVLQGRARTYYAKQLAQHAVLEATEIPLLANEIVVF